MKILIDASSIVDKTTGAGQYSLQLLKALSEIDNRNEYFVILQQKLKGTHPIFNIANNSNFHLIKKDIPAVGPKKQFSYFRLFKKHFNFDILHSLNSELPLLYPKHMKSIVTIHDLKYLKYPYLFGNTILSIPKLKYLKYIIRKSAKKAHKIITISKSTKIDIIKLLNTKEDKIKVIYLASNIKLYSDCRSLHMVHADILKKYSIKKPYLLYVGEKRPHKNLKGLIKAFALFKQKGDNWNTYLVVTGKEYSDYKDYIYEAEKLGVSNNVIITGFIPDEYMYAIYAEAEILLLVSFYEGFGIPILEAMECKTPVITSNISSMPEVAGDAASLVNPNNIQEIAEKINSIMNSDILKKQLIEKGLKRIKDFSWRITAEETLEVYDKIYSK